MNRSCQWTTMAFCLLVNVNLLAEEADDVLLLIKQPPVHGLVVAEVALPRELVAQPGYCLRATSDDDGQSVPIQFVPAADVPSPSLTNTERPVDSKLRRGLVLLRLSSKANTSIRLRREKAPPREPARQEGLVTTPAYTVRHDPHHAAAVPAEIQFAASGKRFQNFSWNDRLYDQQSGSFYLRNDQDASLQRVADGPLATVLETRAAYLNSEGQPPESRPTAIYRWHYFHQHPLLFVTATIVQKDPAAWDELHFLELNFPGDDFSRWSGGPPTESGDLEGSQTSHRLSGWAAVQAQQDAIAMFGSGRILVHDGRGRYGTYLHASGDRAWQAWSDTAAHFSGWLWIGQSPAVDQALDGWRQPCPDNVPLVVSRSHVHQSIVDARREISTTSPPDRTRLWQVNLAEQLEAQGRFAAASAALRGNLPANWNVLHAGDLRLVTERHPTGLRLVSLCDLATGHEHLPRQPAALFDLELRAANRDASFHLTADAGWNHVTVRPKDDGWEFRWSESRQDAAQGIQVVARAVVEPGDHALRWRFQVHNSSDRLGIWQVTFPRLDVVAPGDAPAILFPRGPGEINHDAWKQPFSYQGVYPNGWTTMAFQAVYDQRKNRGLYVATHDPTGSTKTVHARSHLAAGSVEMSTTIPVPEMGQPGNQYTMPGEVVWQLFSGDWFDAAGIYRDWVRDQAEWYPELSAAGRADTPLWLRELPVWVMSGGPPDACVDQVKRFAEAIDVPVGFHWYNWHQIPFDNDYPHYFPAKTGFTEGVRQLRQAGVYVMPYINGRLWDTHDRGPEDYQFTARGLAGATKDQQGQPYTETYRSQETDGRPVRLAAMCPATDVWQNKVHSITSRLFDECKVNGIYIDQIAAASPKLCFDAKHGHPLGGGHWWTRGYWKMLDRIRSDMPADGMLTTECNAEPYVRWFDGYLTWHWQYDGQVAAFPAVYGGAIQMFGRAYRGGPTQELALRMKAGQQLVFGEQIGWFSPDVADQPKSMRFLRQVVGLRWKLRRYFYAGEMARPPQLEGQIPSVRADWQWSGTWNVTTDSILTGAWQLKSEKRLVLIFVNVSDAAVQAEFRFDGQEFGLPANACQLSRMTAAESGEPISVQPRFSRQLEFPPRSAWAWEIFPSSEGS